MFSLHPGAAGPWLNLQEMLRQRHEWQREARDKEIAHRTSLGVPLDDDRLDWRGDVAEVLKGLPIDDRAAAVLVLERARELAAGGLQPLPAFVPNDDHAEIFVRMRSLSKDEVLSIVQAIAAAKTSSERLSVMSRFVGRSLVGLRGDFGADGTVDEADLGDEQLAVALDVLDRAGLVPAIYTCAKEYQTLSPLRRRGFGSLRPSTSPNSVAASVLEHVERSSGASAEPAPRTSAASPSRPIAALSATPSTTTPSTAATASSPSSSPSGDRAVARASTEI